jgi:hypothetical protein
MLWESQLVTYQVRGRVMANWNATSRFRLLNILYTMNLSRGAYVTQNYHHNTQSKIIHIPMPAQSSDNPAQLCTHNAICQCYDTCIRHKVIRLQVN